LTAARRREVPRWRFGDDVRELERALAHGAVLAIPTESSYGLGVDPRSAAGVEAIYRLKRRERGKPLPVVAADERQLLELGVSSDDPALVWARARWPAALTVLLPLPTALPATGSAPEIAVRIPAHDELRSLLRELGHALTATSANPSGEWPYLEPDPLAEWLATAPHVEAILVDAGPLRGGLPSTIVEWTLAGPRVLRAGRFEV
jgi:L-threonylcarbamoyladenylate synthase